MCGSVGHAALGGGGVSVGRSSCILSQWVMHQFGFGQWVIQGGGSRVQNAAGVWVSMSFTDGVYMGV